MDLSNNNQVDLLYLINPHLKIKYNQKKSILDADDVRFYRKRILQSTKDYLREKTISKEIKHAYELYVSSLIGLYKFTDKQKLIQEEYKDIPKKKNKKMSNFKLLDQNRILIKNRETIKKTIKDFIPIVVTERKKKYLILPKKKEYNIRNPINRNRQKEKSNLIISDGKNKTEKSIKDG
jgi:hypothetical protein